MTAGTRPLARSFLTPARLASVRGKAFNATDFMVPQSVLARSTGAPALKLKQRSYRGIAMDSLDRFAQQPSHRKRGDFHPVNRRAQNSISRDEFVNNGFFQPLNAQVVQNRMGNAGINTLRAFLPQQRRRLC